MGTWGLDSFENDDAVDWVDKTARSKDPRERVENVLGKIQKRRGLIELPECQIGVAAAECVATALGRPGPSIKEISDDLVDRLRKKGTRTSWQALTSSAASAVKKIADSPASELRAVMIEAEKLRAWRSVVRNLLSRLRQSDGPELKPQVNIPSKQWAGDCFRILGRSRKKPRAGDLFIYQLVPGRYHFGLVVRDNAKWGGAAEFLILYFLREHSHDATKPPIISRDDLLIPPQLTNDVPWSKGFFKTVAHVDLNDQNSYPRHCLYHSIYRNYRDENGNPVPEPFNPVMSHTLCGYLGLEQDLLVALRATSK